MLQDLRFALRQLVRRPGFTVIAVLTLALGIGANTAVFSAVYAVLLARLPYPEPDQLQRVIPTFTGPDGAVDSMPYWSYPEYEAFRSATHDVTAAAYTPRALSYNLSGQGPPRRAMLEIVSGSYFGLLGVQAAVGRTFTPDEDAVPDARPVAVIGNALWHTAFAGDTGIVGRTLTLNGVDLTVVGVAPPGFAGLSGEADVWAPTMMAPSLVFRNRLNQKLSFWMSVIARVPRASAPLARTEMASAARVMADRMPFQDAFGPVRVGLASRPLAASRTDPSLARTLLILLAAVACVLLIACVNVANLLMARGARRARELGLRVSLGAGRGRLVRQLLTESALLGLLGAGAALLVARWGLVAVAALRPLALAGPGTLEHLRLSVPVLAFDVAVALVAILVFGTAPALAAVRTDPRTLLGRSVGHRRTGPRGALVAGEVALALALLVGAGLLLRSFSQLRSTPLGFEPHHVLAAWVNVPRQTRTGDEATRLFTETARRIEGRPGVERVAVANCLPAHVGTAGVGGCDHVGMKIEGDASGAPKQGREVWMNMVSGSYFATMGIPVLEGRTLEPGDRADAPRVAVVTRAAADRYWPGRDPVGARIQLTVGWGPEDDWATVVGVVGNVVGGSVREAARPGVYLSYPQFSYQSNYLVVRGSGDASGIAAAIRSSLREVDRSLPLWDVRTMDERVAQATAGDRFGTALLGAFGLLALSLAAVGIYGVLAFSVAGRTREMGLRMAVGADRGDVVLLVLREGLRLTAIGLGTGLVLAAGFSRVLRSQLYEISPLDPAAFVAAVVLILAVAGLACWIPARRATRVDPMEALRYE